MPVDSTHNDYKFWNSWWSLVEDLTIGHPAVKAGGQTYLPKSRGMTVADYNDYAALATFFNATGRTLNAIVGMLFRKPAQPQNVPASIENRLKNIDRRGNSLLSFLRVLGREDYKRGRVGVLLDNLGTAPIGTVPFLTAFTANQIIDWVEGRDAEGNPITEQVRIRDRVQIDSLDEFMPDVRDRIRSYEIVDGIYQIREWIADDKGKFPEAGTIQSIPNRRGEPLAFVPFRFFSPFPGTGASTVPPPILDLAIENLAYHWANADYENARHIAGNPTLTVADDRFKQDASDPKKRTKLGPRQALFLGTGGEASFTSLDADLIRALLEPLHERKENMAALGLQMIAPQQRAVEASETHVLRQAGETATLIDVAMSLSSGMTWLLQKMSWWAGDEETEANQIMLDLPTDFIPTKMDPSRMQQLLAAVQQGKLSTDSLLWSFSEGEILPPGRTIEEEKELIALDDESLLREVA